jgi:glycosyltransferase involved in cell wall biosynthesis
MAEERPRVSIVTVVLNGRSHVEDCIRSVLAQDYPAIEYHIVDGGSTDGTLDVIRRYEDRLTSWKSEPDRGIADAFNKGLAMASGDYVLFLNSDDLLAAPNAVGRAMRSAREAGFPDIVFGDCDVVERESGARLRTLKMAWSPLAFRLGRMINHPATFTHASYFRKYGEFDASFRIAMDFELLARGILASRVLHVPGVLTLMRSGGVSTRDRDAAVNEIVRALKKNSLVRSRAGELLVRGYWAARRVMRPLRRWPTTSG